ncbi:MAG: hypothetical protein HUU18_11900 [Phycisphaerales bacterium]|nr:hypothetical protein [Phycisphaerales bacterium]
MSTVQAPPARPSPAERITQFIERNGGDHKCWFIGVTCNPREQLICEHCINSTRDPFLIIGCDTADEARRVEYSLRKKLGGWGKRFDGLDPAAIFVYTFRLSSATVPNLT